MWVTRLLKHGVLISWSLLALFPMVWLWQVAVTPGSGLLGQTPPSQWTLSHFVAVCQQLPFGMFTLNSAIVCGLSVGLTLLTSVLVAFPLACLPVKGRWLVEALVMISVLVPFQVLMIPLFLLCQGLHLTEANGPIPMYLGLSLPFWVSGFGIIIVRQAFAQLPASVFDAARLDGCTPWQQLFQVGVPMVLPTLGLLAILTFLASWGELLWPSVLLSQPQHFPLSVGLVQLQGAFSSNWRLIAAGTLLGTAPVIVVFLLCQRLFIPQGNAGAEKG
jgi:putative chitobiose transport system permease protein